MRYPSPAFVQFWWFVGLALVFLVPLGHATARRWVFAAINLGILLLMLRADFTWALVFIALAWTVFQNLAGRLGRIWFTLGGLATLALFLIYKLPTKSAAEVGLGSVNPILAMFGFSYVMLRLFDAARAIREGRQAPPDLASTINYLLPFHMLAAGPIQSYDEFVAQPAVPAPLSTRDALIAIERIANGLFKKYVLAQGLEALLLTGFHAHGAYTILEIQLAYIWLYLDFSAYSDIAVGIGRLIGVATPENFNRPYLARNVIDFWERWHISLSMFIRRNVFIPIQLTLVRQTGGRAPLWIASFAFAVSFLLCGLWHSVSWVGVAWGLCQAAGLIICNLYRHWLTKRIGRKGLVRYMANPWVRVAATALTFEFAAIPVSILICPSSELSLSWLTNYWQ
jgi:alginate O-acetyltransferase complex protein AlgI